MCSFDEKKRRWKISRYCPFNTQFLESRPFIQYFHSYEVPSNTFRPFSSKSYTSGHKINDKLRNFFSKLIQKIEYIVSHTEKGMTTFIIATNIVNNLIHNVRQHVVLYNMLWYNMIISSQQINVLNPHLAGLASLLRYEGGISFRWNIL